LIDIYCFHEAGGYWREVALGLLVTLSGYWAWQYLHFWGKKLEAKTLMHDAIDRLAQGDYRQVVNISDLLYRCALSVEDFEKGLQALKLATERDCNQVIAAYQRDMEELCQERRVSRLKQAVGDTTCKNNARSPYIQCAINPKGSCQECKHFE
jgi:Family of unknown function (DUF6464)